MSGRQIACPACGEEDDLKGHRSDTEILVTCGECGQEWARPLAPRCPRCGGDDLQSVPVAVVEKSRGTQLSVVGIRTVEMCSICDRHIIQRWQAHRPNPLMPGELPNAEVDTGE